MEHTNLGVRIDNIVLTNIKVLEFKNIEYLKKLGIVRLNDSGHVALTQDGTPYSSLTLICPEDNDSLMPFDRFSVHSRPQHSKHNNFANSFVSQISITPTSSTVGNLVGFTVFDLKKRVEKIQDYLRDTFGINVDFSEALISQIEIQSTIILDKNISAYQRFFSLFTALLPPRCKKEFRTHDIINDDFLKREGLSAYTRSGKRGISVRLYDKTSELESKGYYIDEQYIRYEIRINGNVKRKLKDNRLSQLMQSDIENYFFDFFKKKVFEKYQNYKKERFKRIGKIAKKCLGQHCWRNALLLQLLNLEAQNKVPLALDIAEIIGALEQTEIRKEKNSRQKKYSDMTEIKKICKKNELLFINDSSKRETEVFTKFMEGCGRNVNT